jgi:tetratricopeptide (TPR) repeat protein
MSTTAHAFVAMPFGTKPGRDGHPIDFNRVFHDYIKPALEDAGLTVFRADEEVRAGDIRTDMFQELLVADLVLADLTIDNPNVWYELGVRHALRARGVVLISGGQVTTAFDLYTDRKLRYGIENGGPDPATLEEDKRALTAMVKATMESWHGRKISPVYCLMPNLQEPDWKTLRLGDVREFWDLQDAWEGRVELARRTGRFGDLLVLADEAPVAAFRADAWIKSGEVLRKAERFRYALEYLDRGLRIEPSNLHALREKGICLQRLALAKAPGHSFERAREHYRAVLDDFPADVETWALLGRLDKDAWIAAWRQEGFDGVRRREEAAYEDALLRAAIDSYTKAYRTDPGHYYSGINAVTLMHLYRHLTGNGRYDADVPLIAGAVRFAAECEINPAQAYWSRATLADLALLGGTVDEVRMSYKEAIARNDKDWFALNSSHAQLLLMKDLGFRPEVVEAAIATFERALTKLTTPDARWQPRQVILFSGHMVDAPERKEPRLPDDKAHAAGERIAAALEQLGAGPEDLAFCQAAAGGDLLFLEACRQRRVHCQVLLPFPEPEFIEKSIAPSANSGEWRARYFAIKDELAATGSIRIMPEELGPLPAGVDPYERCNLWLLYSALACGVEKARFVCLWNGAGGDAPGGTAHMLNEVKRLTGRVTWIDTRTL